MKFSLAAGVIALLALVVLGVFFINVYVDQERQRDLLQWESRLGLVADGKATAIGRMLADDLRDLGELAGNASLQLYLWQATTARRAAGDSGQTDESGQQAYLRNLLLAAADRYGYLPDDAARVAADLPRPRTTGLALLDADLKPVVVTPGMSDIGKIYGGIARRAMAQPRTAVTELLLDAHERAVIAFAVPVPALLGTGAGEKGGPIGVLLGVRSAEQDLFPLLTRGPSFSEDSETLLLARRDDAVAYLSPMRDGSGALRRVFPLNRGATAEAAAVLMPGGFAALPNYRGLSVLQVSRPILGQSWILAQQVDADQALSEANEQRRFLITALSLLLFAIAALAAAAWRHGSSVRAQHHAAELEEKAAKLQRQTELLHTVTDNIDVLTLLTTREQTVLFTNEAAARAVHSSIPAIVGSPLTGVLGVAAARELQPGFDQSRQKADAIHQVLSLDFGGASRIYRASFIPVERIGEQRDLTLLVLDDITELQLAERKHTDLLRRLVGTLVHAVDLHDPYSAQHGTRLAEVADAVARELGLPDEDRETLDLAAMLANIGKIMIPSEVLTKAEPITDAERDLIRTHVDRSLELLQGLDFEGPVLDIIAQKEEHLDGSGYPRGLSGEQLTTAGRILSVANAFVALVSIRAYRKGVSVSEALEELMRGAGTRYDRRVIAALFHVAENRRDWSQWT